MEDLEKEAAIGGSCGGKSYKPGKVKKAAIEKVSADKRASLVKAMHASSEKVANRRTMVSDITSSFIPTLVMSWDPNTQSSQLFVKKMDKALAQISGLDRLKIVVLNTMMDKNTASKLSVPQNGAVVYRGEKKLLTISPGSSSMAMAKTLSENRALLS